MPLRNVYFYLFLAVVIMGVGFGLKIFNNERYSAQSSKSSTLAKSYSTGVPTIGGQFSLINQNGDVVSNDTYQGKYVLIFFGYTFCPDICPSTLATFSTVAKLLGDEAAQVKPVFVTVDPLRDTPKVLKSYLEHFHKSFDGLTGSLQQIEQIKKAFRIFAGKSQEAGFDKAEYLMDHSSISYLLGPDGKFITFFRFGADAEVIVTKLKTLL